MKLLRVVRRTVGRQMPFGRRQAGAQTGWGAEKRQARQTAHRGERQGLSRENGSRHLRFFQAPSLFPGKRFQAPALFPVEPRAIKRRPKPHKLLTKPRAEARAELLAGADKE